MRPVQSCPSLRTICHPLFICYAVAVVIKRVQMLVTGIFLTLCCCLRKKQVAKPAQTEVDVKAKQDRVTSARERVKTAKLKTKSMKLVQAGTQADSKKAAEAERKSAELETKEERSYLSTLLRDTCQDFNSKAANLTDKENPQATELMASHLETLIPRLPTKHITDTFVDVLTQHLAALHEAQKKQKEGHKLSHSFIDTSICHPSVRQAVMRNDSFEKFSKEVLLVFLHKFLEQIKDVLLPKKCPPKVSEALTKKMNKAFVQLLVTISNPMNLQVAFLNFLPSVRKGLFFQMAKTHLADSIDTHGWSTNKYLVLFTKGNKQGILDAWFEDVKALNPDVSKEDFNDEFSDVIETIQSQIRAKENALLETVSQQLKSKRPNNEINKTLMHFEETHNKNNPIAGVQPLIQKAFQQLQGSNSKVLNQTLADIQTLIRKKDSDIVQTIKDHLKDSKKAKLEKQVEGLYWNCVKTTVVDLGGKTTAVSKFKDAIISKLSKHVVPLRNSPDLFAESLCESVKAHLNSKQVDSKEEKERKADLDGALNKEIGLLMTLYSLQYKKLKQKPLKLLVNQPEMVRTIFDKVTQDPYFLANLMVVTVQTLCDQDFGLKRLHIVPYKAS